ncbi:Integrase [Alkalibacterium sp. AK22]|uniref:tyrosine-type recombinase/integrase n=1 Tax=Alkalibacterium sp. AK22 TaxID=1229520 RepID=UPI0004452160|nr:site-specific integrase [Alkalibacterium sp. AK22]EXJ22649.1 Integrase [Alkalibacterium sp. AK22]
MGLYTVDLTGREDSIEFGNVGNKNNELKFFVDILETRLRMENLRSRTIHDYLKWYKHYIQYCNSQSTYEVSKLDANSIYDWLDSMKVSDSTKNIRLKSLKASLNRLYDMNYFKNNYWKNVRIRIDIKQKHGANENDVQKLLSTLNLNDFFGLRDAAAILLMYRTGIRNSTMMQVREKHFDFSENIIYLDGSIMKNHKKLALPIDNQLSQLLQLLIFQNSKIRNHNNVHNDYLFISRIGEGICVGGGHSNTIQKRLFKYSNKYNIENISPHGLRRGFATNLLKSGANIALISKALGHSSLEVTTRYLDISEKELIEGLREFQNK